MLEDINKNTKLLDSNMLEMDLITLAILLVFSAFFSGVETALVSLDRIKAKQLEKK